MTYIPKPQEIYKHFKGKLYQIITLAKHSESGEMLVIYQALYDDFKIYARPLDMFTSKVDKVKYPDIAQEYRFERVESKQANGACESCEKVSKAENDVINVAKEENKQEENKQTECKQADMNAASENAEPEELDLDPAVLEFLDADSYEERLNILAGLHHRITNEMITTMAISCDIEVEEGDTEQRYNSLKNCLLTLEKFECNRLR